jgi:hypothetical protein
MPNAAAKADTIAITLDTYSHVLQGMGSGTADAMYQVISSLVHRRRGLFTNSGPDHPDGPSVLLLQTDGAAGDRRYALGNRSTEEERLRMKRLR